MTRLPRRQLGETVAFEIAVRLEDDTLAAPDTLTVTTVRAGDKDWVAVTKTIGDPEIETLAAGRYRHYFDPAKTGTYIFTVKAVKDNRTRIAEASARVV